MNKADISVVVCTRNRAESLREALKSLFAQQHLDKFAFEVIVVDNNSTDNTKKAVEDLILQGNGHLRYVIEPSRGLSFARNKGIEEAVGEIVAFTDDDCVVDVNWLNTVYECARETHFDALGGKILPAFPDNTPQWIKVNQDLLRGPIVFHDYGDETIPYEKPMIEFVGANMAFKRTVFDEYGNFRTDIGVGQGIMGEDTEFFKRLANKGKKMYYCGKAVIWHPVDISRMSLRYVGKWSFGLGRYRYIVDEKNKQQEPFVCYFGVPRYLIREILRAGLSLGFHLFNKREFLRAWKMMFVNIGRAVEMRRVSQCSK